MPAATTIPDRLALGAAVVLTCCLFLPAAADPVNPVKLTVLVWAAVAMIALAAARAVLDGELRIPTGAPAVAGTVLLGAFTSAALVAPVSTVAIVGTYGRNSGYLAYVSGLVLFLGGLLVLRQRSVFDVAVAMLLAGSFTAGYGLLQRAHHDPINWSNPFNPIIASLGNPDFASAYLGICTPIAAWMAVDARLSRPVRTLGGGLAVVFLVTAVLSGAIQGPLAAAAGLLVVFTALSLNLRSGLRRVSFAAIAGIVLAVGVVGAAGLMGRGPGASALSGTTYEARTWYWEAAFRMLRAHPFFGVGLDAYGSFFRVVRPLAATRRLGGNEFSDAAHSVPLQMAAQGGVVLAAAYVLFVGTILVLLLRGLRDLRGAERLQLGGVGGAWVASQIQSWVSIDQVPLIVAQFVLAAAVVVASGRGRIRSFGHVRATGPAPPTRGGRSRRPPPPPVRSVGPGARVALIGIALGALVLLWTASRPLRADISAHSGDAARAEGRVQSADSSYQRAVHLMPGISRYWARIAGMENSRGNIAGALQAYAQATRHDPYDIDAWRNEGRLAEAAGDLRLARFCFNRAIGLDPTNDATVLDHATFELRHGGAQSARASLAAAVRVLPESAALWASLGDAQAVLDQTREARESYGRALALLPGEPTATKGLARLDALRS